MATFVHDVPTLLLTTNEAAAALRISPRKLIAMTKSGEIPAIRIGRRSVRYNPRVLQDFIEHAPIAW